MQNGVKARRMTTATSRKFSHAAPAPVVEYIAPAPAVLYAAPAQVVEYLTPAPLIMPHLSQLQQLASVLSLWSPLSLDDDSCCFCERHVHSATIDVGSIASTNAAFEKLRPRLRVP